MQLEHLSSAQDSKEHFTNGFEFISYSLLGWLWSVAFLFWGVLWRFSWWKHPPAHIWGRVGKDIQTQACHCLLLGVPLSQANMAIHTLNSHAFQWFRNRFVFPTWHFPFSFYICISISYYRVKWDILFVWIWPGPNSYFFLHKSSTVLDITYWLLRGKWSLV